MHLHIALPRHCSVCWYPEVVGVPEILEHLEPAGVTDLLLTGNQGSL